MTTKELIRELSSQTLFDQAQSMVNRNGDEHVYNHIDSYGRLVALETIQATDYIPHVVRVKSRGRFHQIPVFIRLEYRNGQILDSLPFLDEPPIFREGIMITYTQARESIPQEGILYRFDEETGELINRREKRASSSGRTAFENILNKLERYYGYES